VAGGKAEKLARPSSPPQPAPLAPGAGMLMIIMCLLSKHEQTTSGTALAAS
jgi:hypothetical protein